jgi:hypothetical protein
MQARITWNGLTPEDNFRELLKHPAWRASAQQNETAQARIYLEWYCLGSSFEPAAPF